MKTRNKLFIILISVIILVSFSLISCGRQVSSTTTVLVTTTTREITTTSVISDGSVKFGLSETQRKRAFYEVVELEDLVSLEDSPDRAKQMEEANSIIAKKYNITKDEMTELGIEGIEKNWPMPPVK
jgi:hypothetical protein